jgi:hypothetical protein
MCCYQLTNQVNIIATQLTSLKGETPAHGHQHTGFVGLSPDLIFKEQKIDTLGFFKKSFATKWDYTPFARFDHNKILPNGPNA